MAFEFVYNHSVLLSKDHLSGATDTYKIKHFTFYIYAQPANVCELIDHIQPEKDTKGKQEKAIKKERPYPYITIIKNS